MNAKTESQNKIPLQDGIIYGPLESRRLGTSLGINLSPTSHKSCNFNCIYCQYGPNDETVNSYDPDRVPEVEEVRQALRKKLRNLNGEPDHLTFSGNGEPTIHPKFNRVAKEVRKVRDKHSPDSKIALLSNSSTVTNQAIRDTINSGLIDLAEMKLDAGTQESFLEINRPAVDYQKVLRGLQRLEDFVIQSIKFRGEVDNLGDAEKWIQVVGRLQPEAVQIYSLDRPAAKDIRKASQEDLLKLKKTLKKSGIETKIF
jgi:wyosine [tRNA(Phe)-imidazoG37] synthetase (radical SAM superfamily)